MNVAASLSVGARYRDTREGAQTAGMVGRVRPNHLVIKTRAVPGAELIESVRLRSVVTKVGTRDSVAAQDIVQDKARARQFYFVGKKVNGSALAPGVYTGKAT